MIKLGVQLERIKVQQLVIGCGVFGVLYIYFLSYIQLVLEAKLENGRLMLKCCSYETI